MMSDMEESSKHEPETGTEHLLKESMLLKIGSGQEIDRKAEPGNQGPGWGLWPLATLWEVCLQ